MTTGQSVLMLAPASQIVTVTNIGLAEIPNNIVEVAADAVSRNQDGSYSLRFPRFVRFRGFEPNEKL